MGGSWVINPPLSSWLNATAVHQKPNFKVWGRTVLEPFSCQLLEMHIGSLFSACLAPSGIYILFVLVESL